VRIGTIKIGIRNQFAQISTLRCCRTNMDKPQSDKLCEVNLLNQIITVKLVGLQ